MAKVAVINKSLASSSKTQQEVYGKASAFLSVAGNARGFDEQIKKSGSRKMIAEKIIPSQASIPGIENPREIIRWAFKAEKGDVSDQVFEIDNKFVIAKLVDVSEKGALPLEKVKKQIEPMVLNQVKAEKLADRLNKAKLGSKTIEQLAQKVGKTAVPVQNVVLANPIIPGVAQENKVIGTVFGSQPGKLSKIIEAENGVYVIAVSGFSNPAPLTNVYKQKVQISQNLAQRASAETFKVLREKAAIKDHRVKFF